MEFSKSKVLSFLCLISDVFLLFLPISRLPRAPLCLIELQWGRQHPDFELIGQTWKNKLFSYVGYDARVDAIKIVFRGTKMHDISNDLADAHVTLSKCSFCGNTKVHTGFYQSFNTLIHAGLGHQIEQAVEQYPGAQVHCTGHSLGGSMAVLAALWTHSLFPTLRVSMYTFGQPRVGLAPFAKYLMRTGIEHFRVVQDKDVIPHMPPTTVGFRHSTVEVWFRSGQISPRFSDMAESQESSSSNSLRVHMSVNDHLNYLGFNEDGCSTPTCICPRGIPSTGQCSGSVNNYEIRSVLGTRR